MREIAYRNLSLKTHAKNLRKQKPSVCQFELTFACDLHCRHCYSDCYNKPAFTGKELNTQAVKLVIDKIYKTGVLWLGFTGGDPLKRKDFLDIYAYAKNKGFMIAIFTNGYSMNPEISAYLKKSPPFRIEITLNAVTQDLYEQISQLKGSFSKTQAGLRLILKAGLPLKLKTLVTKDNLGQLGQIKNYVEKLGLRFSPSILLHARLNGDLSPCALRISPQDASSLNGNKKPPRDNCQLSLKEKTPRVKSGLFPCAVVGGDGMNIDPYGNIVPCTCIRQPRVNLLQEDLKNGRQKIMQWLSLKQSSGAKGCRVCFLRKFCYNCPGKALLERGSLAAKLGWYCDLAKINAS